MSILKVDKISLGSMLRKQQVRFKTVSIMQNIMDLRIRDEQNKLIEKPH